MTNWRDKCGSKLVPLEAALQHVQSGQTIAAAPYSTTPFTLCNGIMEKGRRGELENVRVEHLAAACGWADPANNGVFHLYDNYATAPNRAACHVGDMNYMPVGLWRSYEMPAGFATDPDVYLVPVSPPDENGFCSFGPGVWMSPTLVKGAKVVIAEVVEDFIRTFGENFVHVDDIDFFVESQPQATGGLAAPGPSDEEVSQIEAICTQVAVELVNDGDTLQMGVGTVSASLAPFLDFRNDLGVQTELITGGVAELVQKGNITGRRKSIHRGKVVGSALVAMPREELLLIHENPVFELFDFGYTDDLRRLIQLENFVTVNNALVVDLTGQVAAESFNHQMYTGVGGQTVFMMAGAYSPGGKSVSVVPSSSVPSSTGVRVSRIVPVLAPGTPVTVPRTYVDYVVTEFGIAELRGKSVLERVALMCDIAHPDFRDELRAQGKTLYGK